MKKLTFSAVLKEENRGGVGICIPFDVKEIFGTARAKVKIKIDKHIYRTTIAVMGGRYLLGVRKEIRDLIGKKAGDEVNISMELDTEERIVVIPEDFKKKLAKNKKANTIFNNFAYTHRKEYAAWIESAKKKETRDKRLAKAIEMIANNEKFS